MLEACSHISIVVFYRGERDRMIAEKVHQKKSFILADIDIDVNSFVLHIHKYPRAKLCKKVTNNKYIEKNLNK